jgi:hypothetical protein
MARASEPECVDWFKAAKIPPNSKDCMMKCAVIGVDMGTFTCPLNCDELCKPQLDNCPQFREKARKAIKDGRPSTWGEKVESTKAWSKNETDQVITALSKLPPKLVKIDDFSVYRMSHSVHKGNPASTYDSSIALYDEAFSGKVPLNQVMAHELAHAYWNKSMSPEDRKNYGIGAGWLFDPRTERAFPGRKASEFVQEDGMTSPSEDFGNNVEKAIVNEAHLKKISPSVFNYFQLYFGDSLKQGGPCVPQSKSAPQKTGK